MEFTEVRQFIKWWAVKQKDGTQQVHYKFGFGNIIITDNEVTKLQLTVLGVRTISLFEAIALETVFQMLNEINDAPLLPPESGDEIF